jgi:hypothetical protein
MGTNVKYPYVTDTKALDTGQTRSLGRGDVYDDNNCKDDEDLSMNPIKGWMPRAS